MHISELRKLSYADLVRELESSRQELFNLRFRLSTKQMTNYREITTVKKKIAKIKTLMREIELIGSR
ncbi:MAG: 50S ribosomal protein L29 [Dehalococcoidia bacterium]